jgi:hypothetical protein
MPKGKEMSMSNIHITVGTSSGYLTPEECVVIGEYLTPREAEQIMRWGWRKSRSFWSGQHNPERAMRYIRWYIRVHYPGLIERLAEERFVRHGRLPL